MSNGCTLSHLAVLESGATPTQRKRRVGRVSLCAQCCSNNFILRECWQQSIWWVSLGNGTVRLVGCGAWFTGSGASPIVFWVIPPCLTWVLHWQVRCLLHQGHQV